ncbi:Undecaprenyl phosphate N,N'-diacetylbacillosamine 1-phosphate transferase [bioreactor metagenome]|uniref:Undecaprenyl phosphate N,N'-diacetylbacillosamine 1-phosphate transferase n=1 Tax=bioreactor metagenome TaxID=1076179 RepID=A0A644XT05_9ZZZZ
MTGKRIFDLFFSAIAILILLVPGLLLALIIMMESRGGAFYRQVRVGRNEKPFRLLKFRTMFTGSDAKGLLTVGSADNRVTGFGKFLRRSKMDELPQMINILAGQMSFVGPRPEVPKYVAMYSDEQKKVLSVRPGLTDYASLEYINESDLLAQQSDPEKYYIETVMPAKLSLNLKYIKEMSCATDLKIIFRTLFKIGRRG